MDQTKLSTEIRDLALVNLDDMDDSTKMKVISNLLGYKTMPVDIDTFLDNPYYLGNVSKELYPFWRDILRAIFPTPLHTSTPILVFTGGIGCIEGSSRIRLADGRVYPIRELHERWPNGGFRVLSYDVTAGCIVEGHCTGAYHTGRKPVCEVTLQSLNTWNETKVRCTLDHKFLNDLGVYVEAKDLTLGSLVQSGQGEAFCSEVRGVRMLEGRVDVYDLTVDVYHNYGILDSDGGVIFTHNTGKSTAVRFAAEYMKHRIACLKNPYKTFGFVPGKNIKFSYFHKTAALAKTDFLDVMELWEAQSPYFEELRKMGSLDIVEEVADSIRTNVNIGSDVLFYNLSELNFIGYERAHEKLDQALKRWSSRFDRISEYFGMVVIDTSSRGDDSIADEFISSNPYGDLVRSIHTNAWIVREHLHYYGNKGWFRVFTGDGVHEPFIIDPQKGRTMTSEMDQDRVIDVPEEMRAEFEFDLITALQDKAGISTSATDRFYGNTEGLLGCFKLPQYSPDVVKFDFYDRTDKLIYRFDRALRDIPTDRIIYIRYDLGVTGDNTGLAVGYFDRWKVYDLDEKVRLPIIKIPLAVGINRFNDQETPIEHLYEFILDLNERFEVGGFSADQFQSRMLLQNLERDGIPNKYLSVDRTDEAYVYLKSLTNRGLVELPMNDVLKKELTSLRRTAKKVDHPANGCFAGGTLVLVKEGDTGSVVLADIESLVWGSDHYRVCSYDEDHDRFQWVRIKAAMMTQRVRDVVKVSFASGFWVVCTPGHPFLLRGVSYVAAGELGRGDISVGLTCDEEIISVERMTLEQEIPVYDLEVEGENPNFCLANGAVVHNSKDIADAVSGLVFHIYQDIDHAGQISNRYRMNAYASSVQERTASPTDAFQDMLSNLF